MADIEVDFQVREPKLDTTINKFKQLKKEMLEAKGALAGLEQGTEAYSKQAAKVGQINDKIKDLNQSVKAVSGEPIENLTGSFGLLRSQVETLDFKGATSSLKSLSTTITGLNMKTLTDGVKGFGTALADVGKALIGNPIFWVAAAVIAIVGAFKLWNDELSEAAQNDKLLNIELEKQARLQESITNEMTNQAKIRKATGMSDVELKRAELADEIKLYSLIRTRQLLLQEIRNKTDEQREELKKLDKQEQDAFTDITVSKIELNKALRKEQKDASEKRVAEAKKEKDEIAALARELREDLAKIDEENLARIKAQNLKIRNIKEEDAKSQLSINAFMQGEKEKMDAAEVESKKKAEGEKLDAAYQTALNERLLKEQTAKVNQQIESNYLSSIGNLSDLYFNIQLSQAEGNAVIMEQVRRKQFNFEKGFRAAQATMDGFRAVTSALADLTTPAPLRIPLAISFGVAAFAQVAKILSTQYNAGRQSPGSVNTPTPNTNQVPTAPPIGGPQTLIRNQNEPAPQRVYVLESDIKKSTNRVSVLQNRATF